MVQWPSLGHFLIITGSRNRATRSHATQEPSSWLSFQQELVDALQGQVGAFDESSNVKPNKTIPAEFSAHGAFIYDYIHLPSCTA